ncbi:hypothetical protein [Methylobacterium thuringiense]|uniref:DUF3040 domain-containing protein n=1 Tax=Methylobacterium thuringiense TaxID=1003091 RepID=A0ABQ4TKU9_9HYPH|nr:hypothetical protein [Methylobacterium thuringiense]GJE55248.1 hypothetical protein EKPJFOCH_1737 [Methylobacterium thuringiense]
MTDDTPATRFDRYLAQVERDPAWQARQARIRRLTSLQKAQRTAGGRARGRRLLHPFYGGPAVGLTIVAVGLLGHWIGLW